MLQPLPTFAADVVSTWNGTTGNWSDANKWSSANFPNNGNGGFTYDAVINSGAISLDQNISISTLSGSGGTVNLSGSNLLTVGDNTFTTFSGVIQDSGRLEKVGSGGLTLAGSNSYSGGTTLTSGVLTVSNDSALGTGTLTLSGGRFTNNAALRTIANPINVTANSVVHANSTTNILTLSGAITGAATITTNIGGHLDLVGDISAFTGTFRISSATPVGAYRQQFHGATAASRDGSNARFVVDGIAPSGQFRFGVEGTYDNPTMKMGSLSGNTLQTGVNIRGSLGQATLEIGHLGLTDVFNGSITSPSGTVVSISKVGTGTLTLGSSGIAAGLGYLYCGALNISDGMVKAGHATALGFNSRIDSATTGNLAAASVIHGTTSAGTMVTGNGQLDLNGLLFNEVITLNSMGGGNGALVNDNTSSAATIDNGVAFVQINSGGSGYSGSLPSIGLSGGGGSGANIVAAASTSVPLALGMATASVTSVSGGSNFTIGDKIFLTGTGYSGTNAVAQVSSVNGAGGITGVSIISPGHGFTNTAAITDAGIVSSANPAASTTGFAMTINQNNYVVSALKLTASGSGYTSVPSISITGGGATTNANATALLSSVNLAGNSSVGGAGTLHIKAIVSGVGSLTKVGAGTLTLSAANTYSGDTKIFDGTLSLGHSSALQNSVLSYDNDGGTLSLGTLTVASLGGLKGSQNLALLNSSSASVALTVGRDNADVTYSGQLSGGSSLTKIGNSTQRLTGDYSFPSGTNINGGKLVVNGTLVGSIAINSNGALAGTSSITGNITSGGRVAPGNSPGILTIDGNYIQTATSVLEIEVGGLVADPMDPENAQHDKVVVLGTATLAGRLDVPIINGFVPAEGDEITFLTTAEIPEVETRVGKFSSAFSPNLAAVSPNLAMKVHYNDADVRLQFVVPTELQFIAPGTTAIWTGEGTWTDNAVPDTTNIVTVKNPIGVTQTVTVDSQNAFVHELNVEGNMAAITMSVPSGTSLSAIAGTNVSNNAVVELSGGNLASANVTIQDGGKLVGNGTVIGNLVLGEATGSQVATLRPGFSVGHLGVEGDFQQGAMGTMLIDVAGGQEGEFDTIDITGEAMLGGTLMIDASDLGATAPGTTVTILTAGAGIAAGTKFTSVETIEAIDTNELYFAPTYLANSVNVTSYPRGDMNRDGVLDSGDVDEFALALMNPDAYFDLRFLYGSQSGNMDGLNGLDFDDIDDFAMVLEMNGVNNALAAVHYALVGVPEPGTVVLLASGAWWMIWRVRPGRRGGRGCFAAGAISSC